MPAKPSKGGLPPAFLGKKATGKKDPPSTSKSSRDIKKNAGMGPAKAMKPY